MSVTWETVSPLPPAQPQDAQEVLQEAFSAGDLLPDLFESAVAANEPILLVVNDPHRSTQTRAALIALAKHSVRSAVRAGAPVRAPRFRAIVATGTHHFRKHQQRAFEQATFSGCGLTIEDVTWHDASRSGSLVEIAGIRMHRWVAESRFLLPIGSVEPHYFAGVTGPHKTVTIGCMSFEDIERNHAGALSPSSDILRLRGNPVFDGVARTLRDLASSGKTICAIGQVVCGGALLAAAAGGPIEVVDALLPTMRRTFVRHVPEPTDVLHLRVPLPLGRSLYQADKALKNNHLAVRDGGGIILEADCPEGIELDAFMNLLRRSSDYATAQRAVTEEGYRLGDHKAVKLRYLMDPACRGVHVAIVSPHLSPSDLHGTGIEVFRDAASALDGLATVVTGPIADGVVIEEAGMVTVTPGTP